MELFQCWLCFVLGIALLLISGVAFKIGDRLFLWLAVNSGVGGLLLFAFAVVGYKFASVDFLSSFAVGLSGLFGLLMTIAFKLAL